MKSELSVRVEVVNAMYCNVYVSETVSNALVDVLSFPRRQATGPTNYKLFKFSPINPTIKSRNFHVLKTSEYMSLYSWTNMISELINEETKFEVY